MKTSELPFSQGYNFMFKSLVKVLPVVVDGCVGNFHFLVQGRPHSNPNAHVFSQSSYMAYSSHGDNGKPLCYQAMASSRQVPGQVNYKSTFGRRWQVLNKQHSASVGLVLLLRNITMSKC